MIVNLIINENHSSIRPAEQFDKTLEKWNTPYNKNNRTFFLITNIKFNRVIISMS